MQFPGQRDYVDIRRKPLDVKCQQHIQYRRVLWTRTETLTEIDEMDDLRCATAEAKARVFTIYGFILFRRPGFFYVRHPSLLCKTL